MTVLLITAKGDVLDLSDQINPVEGKLTLSKAQDLVGGDVELVVLPVGPLSPCSFEPSGAQMFVREDGLMVTHRVNIIASGLAARQIVGEALIFTGEHKWD